MAVSSFYILADRYDGKQAKRNQTTRNEETDKMTDKTSRKDNAKAAQTSIDALIASFKAAGIALSAEQIKMAEDAKTSVAAVIPASAKVAEDRIALAKYTNATTLTLAAIFTASDMKTEYTLTELPIIILRGLGRAAKLGKTGIKTDANVEIALQNRYDKDTDTATLLGDFVIKENANNDDYDPYKTDAQYIRRDAEKQAYAVMVRDNRDFYVFFNGILDATVYHHPAIANDAITVGSKHSKGDAAGKGTNSTYGLREPSSDVETALVKSALAAVNTAKKLAAEKLAA